MAHAVVMAVDPTKKSDVSTLLGVMEAGFVIASAVLYNKKQIVYALSGDQPLPAALLNKVEVRE